MTLTASETTLSFSGFVLSNSMNSRLSRREKSAVYEWIASGKQFHLMRDHPSHSNYAMIGGMWGGTHDAIPNMKSLLLNKNIQHTYLEDNATNHGIIRM
jgi:hypothetical protein